MFPIVGLMGDFFWKFFKWCLNTVCCWLVLFRGKTMKDNCEAPSTAPSVSCTRSLNTTAPQTTPQGSQESSCQRPDFLVIVHPCQRSIQSGEWLPFAIRFSFDKFWLKSCFRLQSIDEKGFNIFRTPALQCYSITFPVLSHCVPAAPHHGPCGCA